MYFKQNKLMRNIICEILNVYWYKNLLSRFLSKRLTEGFLKDLHIDMTLGEIGFRACYLEMPTFI